jgi:outer membrane immunogenic protein
MRFVAGVVFLAATLSIAQSGLAHAADDVVAPDPMRFDWSGLYIGAQAGVGRGHVDWLEGPSTGDFLSNVPGTFILTESPSGSLFGIVGGYNWQSGNVVLGVEGTWSSADIHRTIPAIGPCPTCPSTTEINSLWTAGARVGVAHDNWLLYATGGYASAEVQLTALNTSPFANFAAGDTQDHHGYYLGGGIDWALAPNWILGLQANHFKFEDKMHLDPAPINFPFPLDANVVDFVLNTLTVRLTYKF